MPHHPNCNGDCFHCHDYYLDEEPEQGEVVYDAEVEVLYDAEWPVVENDGTIVF